jgi:hypothetical protein
MARNVAKRGRPGTSGTPFESCDVLTCGNANDSTWWHNGGYLQRHFGHTSTIKPQISDLGTRRVGL